MLTTAKKDFPLLDKGKIQQESKELEGANVKNNFDASTTHQPSIVHEVEMLDTMVLPIDQDKAILFATLIPPIHFISPKKFKDMVKQKATLFLVLLKVLQEVVQIRHARVFIIQHFKTRGQVFFFPNQRTMMQAAQQKIILINFCLIL